MQTQFKSKNTHMEILQFLKQHIRSSRVDIAAQINLTKAAVTGVINEMISEGILTEQGELLEELKKRTRGRRKIIIKINENYKLALGAAVVGKKLVLGLTNLSGGILDRIQNDIPDGCTHRMLLENIVSGTNRLLKENCITMERISSLGICLDSTAPEGNTKEQRIRVKREMSHAVSVPVTATTLTQGAVCAQCLFCDSENISSMLIFHHGFDTEASSLINGKIYDGYSSCLGGLKGNIDYTSQTMPQTSANGLDEKINEYFASTLSKVINVLDTQKVYVFGGYFENSFGITHINMTAGEKYGIKSNIEPAFVTDSSAFLAGCAAGIEEHFFGGSLFAK